MAQDDKRLRLTGQQADLVLKLGNGGLPPLALACQAGYLRNAQSGSGTHSGATQYEINKMMIEANGCRHCGHKAIF
eukprot:scaffold63922_cov20-Prasinocladus_malaysianus.AAC.1